MSARKRLNQFKNVRTKINDNVWEREEPAITIEIPTRGGGVATGGAPVAPEDSPFEMAKNRLDAFKKLRSEYVGARR